MMIELVTGELWQTAVAIQYICTSSAIDTGKSTQRLREYAEMRWQNYQKWC